MIIGCLWDRQVDAIIDVKLGDADADTYKHKPMSKLMVRWEKIWKYNQGKHCNNRRKYFLLFVLSVDRLLGREDLVVLSELSQVMAEKREEPLLQVRGWVNGSITIAVARSYSGIINRARLPSPLWEQEMDWDTGSRIGLAA